MIKSEITGQMLFSVIPLKPIEINVRLELCNRGEFGLLSSRDKNRANTINVFFNKNRFRQTLGLCAVLDVHIELQGFMLDIYLEK